MQFADHKKLSSGFTLIEVMVYLALFAIMFGGAIAAAFNVMESAGRNQAEAQMQEEGEFLLGKFAWAVAGAQSVSSPAVNQQSSILSLSRFDGSRVSLSLSGGNMQIQDSLGTSALNNSNFQPSQLVFNHVSGSGDGVNPESVTETFVLSGKTSGGAGISQTFTSTSYLRK